MPLDELKIAIISDLHCKYGKENIRTTWLISDLLPVPINHHPVEALKELIETDTLKADILLCPGDIADKIDKQGFMSGWKFLEDIKVKLEAKLLISTTGNHDVDSRLMHEHKTHNFIPKNISDKYPIDNTTCKMDYWAKDFFIYQDDSIVLLNFNSTHNHINETESKKSSIPSVTLDAIDRNLSSIKDNRFKVALCHHHPKKFSNLDEIYKDGDVLEFGDKFISVLEKHAFDIIIHGHKHIPKLDYCNNLPVLCAGSFASLMNIREYNCRNTFHFLTLERVENGGLYKKIGKLKTWEFIYSQGWKADFKNAFPCHTGFGYNVDLENLAQNCAKWFKEKKFSRVKIDELLIQYPELMHLIPSYQTRFSEILHSTYGIEFYPSLENNPATIQEII